MRCSAGSRCSISIPASTRSHCSAAAPTTSRCATRSMPPWPPVEAARASLQAAQANRVKADKDATRQEALYAEDPGAISVRRLEIAQATRIEARSKEQAAEADLRKAQEAAGDAGDDNAQLLSARSAIEKAELDLARTQGGRACPRSGDRPAHRCRPFCAGRRAGDDPDRRSTTCGSTPT